ncbi:MAG: septum formation initiator family protein [Clostridia bacterium]|nr:septum formation initiator family protein [Clostridia bacterium]
MQNKKNIPASVRIAFVVFLAIGFIVIGAFWMQYNEQKKKNDLLEQEVNKLSEQVAKKEEELAAPFDKEYIRRVARRELGYGYPGEIFYHSDFEE